MDHPELQQRLHTLHGREGEFSWFHTQRQAIEHIESRVINYFLFHNARPVRLTVGRTATGEKFLKTELDGDTPALLLQLPIITPEPPPTAVL